MESRIRLKEVEAPEWSRPVEVRIIIHGGKSWRANRDIDNVPKGILDAMVLEGILTDDNCEIVRRVIIEYQPPDHRKDDAYCEVIVSEIDGP
jgi:Holliday junction resolvase RusA-like endonuclease